MNISQLRELVRLVEESQIDEIEVSRWGHRVRICKKRRDGNSTSHAVRRGQETAVEPAAAGRPAPPAAPEAPPAPVENGLVLRAPMVGTFYRSPAPDARSFVEVGDRVTPGTVVCIIEAMKLMNEIQSDVAGRVASIEVENAQPVEYAQVLFRITPD